MRPSNMYLFKPAVRSFATRYLDLTVVRHGQTNGNAFGILHGHTDEPLNEAGMTQAGLVARRLKDEHFDLIMSSDLTRAMTTAQTISDANGSLQGRPAIGTFLLRERHFGQFENRPAKEYTDAARAAGCNNSEAVWQKFSDTTTESMDNVMARAENFMENLFAVIKTLEPAVETGNTHHVLVASHCAWIRQLSLYLSLTGRVQNFPSEREIREMSICRSTGLTRLRFALDTDQDRGFASATCDLLHCAKHLDQPIQISVSQSVSTKP